MNVQHGACIKYIQENHKIMLLKTAEIISEKVMKRHPPSKNSW